MKNNDLGNSIEKLEQEIQHLYADYERMLTQYESFYAIKAIRLKIKQAEESLRLQKRILYILLN